MIFAVILMFFIIGCSAPQDTSVPVEQEPAVETPSEPEVTVEEEVITPAAEPENETEEEEPAAEPEPGPVSLLEDFDSAERLISANPDIGSVLTREPRKIMLVFNYPLSSESYIQLFDQTGTKRFDQDNTVIDYDDGVVAFTYTNRMDPGVYMVVYKAVFASKYGNTEQEGYYYFELE